MENNTNPAKSADQKNSKSVYTVNLLVLVLIVLIGFTGEMAFFSFLIGLLAGGINLILMIVFFAQQKQHSGIACLISMLLLPIIGFGCCAAGMTNMRL